MYSGLFYGGLILSIIFLITSIVLFFVLKIPKVFGDLTGRTQKKAIEDIQKSGYEQKSKKEAIHDQTSRITVRDAQSDTSTLNAEKKAKKERIPTRMFEDSTEVLGFENYGKQDVDSTEVLGTGEDSTDVLHSDGRDYGDTSYNQSQNVQDGEATDVLSQEEYEGDFGTTDVLTSGDSDDDYGTTDVLTSDNVDDDYGTTDVLTSPAAEEEAETAVLTSNDGSDEAETAVLTSDEPVVNQRSDVYGSGNEEETAVLRAPQETPGSTGALRKIVEIYSVTEIHTTESL